MGASSCFADIFIEKTQLTLLDGVCKMKKTLGANLLGINKMLWIRKDSSLPFRLQEILSHLGFERNYCGKFFFPTLQHLETEGTKIINL